MGEPVPSMTGEAPLSVADALLAAVLPVRPVEETLGRLAEVWRDRLKVRQVVLGMVDAENGNCLAACADSSNVRNLRGTPLAPGAALGEGLQTALLSIAGDREADRWIPLADSGRVIGGVLLWHQPGVELLPHLPEWTTMTARLLTLMRDYDRRLLHDKLEAMAEFAAGAGHEINNPLGSILIASQRLLKDETNPERRRLLATIGSQALRVRDMIGDAMLFARPPQPQLETFDLAHEVEATIDRFADQLAEKQITLQTGFAPEVPIKADRTQLAVVVSELLRNAIHAVDTEGTIDVSVEQTTRSDRTVGVIAIRDNGKGLSDEERDHLFDPFYSGRQAGRGLGFGLPKAWRIVTNHGGNIRVADNPDAGLTFTVEWPTE